MKQLGHLFIFQEAIQAMYNASLANPNLNLTDRYQQYVNRVRELHQMCKYKFLQVCTGEFSVGAL